MQPMRLLAFLYLASALWAGEKLLPDTLWDWRNVSSPKVSPDGKQVLYQLEWADKMTDAFYSNLWIASSDAKENRPLTQGKFRDTGAAWSPDGKRIAYLSNRSGRLQITVRWLETGDETTITNLENPVSEISWSPDGTQIAFFSRVAVKPKFTVKTAVPPTGAQWTTGPSVVTSLRWRADGIGGAGLLPQSMAHLFLASPDGGEARQVTTGDFMHSGPAAWTPDGKTIVLTTTRYEAADLKLFPDDLYAIDVKTGAARRILERNGAESDPVVSPDGKSLAFLGFEDKGKANHSTRLWTVGLDGKGLKLLAPAMDRNFSTPVWKSDSSGIYVIAEDRGQAHLHLASTSGSIEKLTSGYLRFATAYGAFEKVSAANAVFAVTASSPSAPKDIYALRLGSGQAPLRLTNSNAAMLDHRPAGTVEEITWKSFDGREIQGWVMRPPDFEAGKKYPMILDIHGGPHLMYGIEFNHQMQMFAARGYVVFYTNPRGSTGYGEEFGDIIHGRYPGDDYQDLMTGVDALLAKGYVDDKRLYVTGGSGGGLLTAWIVTQTDRFRAAVSQYPVTNWFTQAGSADIGLLMTRWMKAMPWEKPQQYIERSPVFRADKVKTPTMVLTGEEDWRTPITQSEEFYFALKARGVDSVLVRFPREPHGIRGAFPSHRIQKVEYILGWFDQHP